MAQIRGLATHPLKAKARASGTQRVDTEREALAGTEPPGGEVGENTRWEALQETRDMSVRESASQGREIGESWGTREYQTKATWSRWSQGAVCTGISSSIGGKEPLGRRTF